MNVGKNFKCKRKGKIMTLAVKAIKFGNGVLKSVTRDLKSDGKMVINTFHARPGVKPEGSMLLGRFLTLPKDSFHAKAGLKEIGSIKDGAKAFKNGKWCTENSVYANDICGEVIAVGIDKVRGLIKAIRDYGLTLNKLPLSK